MENFIKELQELEKNSNFELRIEKKEIMICPIHKSQPKTKTEIGFRVQYEVIHILEIGDKFTFVIDLPEKEIIIRSTAPLSKTRLEAFTQSVIKYNLYSDYELVLNK